MENKYKTIQEFIEGLEKQYKFIEIAEIMGWLKKEDVVGGKIFCPFHSPSGLKRERTASCQIGDHFFKCYGCGAKGSIFNFGMLIENTTFYNSVNMIAQALNVEIEDTKALSEQSKLLANYSKQWQEMLDNMDDILKRRKLGKLSKTEEEVAKRYDKLYPLESGYNKSTERVALPFTDINGRVLGFTERAILPEQTPKWKHDNVKYSLTRLCNNIFGLSNIKKEKEAYVVEGPGDISGMLRAGFSNTIAVCGAEHLNEINVEYLSSIGINKLVIVFDGDSAGLKGTIVACKVLLKSNYLLAKKSTVVRLKDDKDPGEYDSKELKKIVDEEQVSVIEFLFKILEQNELKDLYKTSISAVRNDIISWLMKEYKLKYQSEAYKILNEKKNSKEEDIKYLTEKDEKLGKEFGNVSDKKAKALLLRKYGIGENTIE